MTSYLTDLVSWAFFAANAGRVFAYIPQIVAAAECRNGATAVSRATWSYFAFAHFTGALYGFVVIHDPMMAIVFIGNFLACCLLVGLVSWKKWQHDSEPTRPQPLVAPTLAKKIDASSVNVSRWSSTCHTDFPKPSPWSAKLRTETTSFSAPEQTQ